MAPGAHSPEFALVAACCRWPDSAARNTAIRAAADAVRDWSRLLAAARRHRIDLLLRQGLAAAHVALPDAARTRLTARAGRLTRRNLLHYAQSLRLTALLNEAGIDHLFVKGESLALLAYDNLSLKSASDIDLLIAPDDVTRTSALLWRTGYDRLLPAPDFPAHELPLYFAIRKDSLWVHRETGVRVELHHRLFSNRHFMDRLDLRAPRQSISHGGQGSLQTFATPDLFAYLCGHGAIEGWQRLKWVADVAALLAGRGPYEISTLYDHASGHGVARCAGQALLLCSDLLALELPPDLERKLRRDSRTAALTAAARATLTEGNDAAEPGSLRIALRNLRCALLIDRRPRFLANLARGRWVSMADREALKLPRGARALYPLLRVPLMLSRLARPLRRGPIEPRRAAP